MDRTPTAPAEKTPRVQQHNTRSPLRFICILTCGIAFVVISLQAQTASVTGRVTDASTHQPVAGATIILNEPGLWQSTGDSGRFEFRRLAPGRYTLSVRHIGFAGKEIVVTCADGDPAILTVDLQPSPVQPGEMIVRSTRTSAAQEDISYPTEIREGESLLRRPAVTVPDALADEPGVFLERDGVWETDLSIRGLTGSNIVTMIDNTRIETATNIGGALSLIDLHDVERAEVVKSPGSVLYGTGAFGGVLNLITQRPVFSDRPALKADISNEYSSVNSEAGEHAALAWSDSSYALRLSGSCRNASNTATPLGEIPHSQFHDFNINCCLAVRTTSEQTAYVSYQRSQADDTGIPGGSSFSSGASVRYTLARRELFGFEYHIPNLVNEVPMITFRLSRQEIDRNVEVIQSPVLTLTPHATHGTTSGQLESQILLPERQMLTVGGEIWQRDLDSRREKTNSATGQIVGDLPVPGSHFYSAGCYAQDEWNLLPDRLTVTLGARYDRIHVSSDEALNPVYVVSHGKLLTSPPGQKVLWNSTFDRDGSASASGGIVYALTPGLNVTALVATAFRAPSLEERFDYLNLGSIIQAGNPFLKPERSTSFNTGVRYRKDGLRLQADIYYNDLTDLVAFEPGTFEGQPAYVEQNIGSAALYGYEISGEKSITDWESAGVSASFVRGEDRLDHTNLPQIPPFSARIVSKSSVGSIGTIGIAVGGCAAQDNPAAGEPATAGYVVTDIDLLGSPLRVEGFSVVIRAGVQNLFDKLYQNHLSTLRGFITYEPGRNYFLTATIGI